MIRTLVSALLVLFISFTASAEDAAEAETPTVVEDLAMREAERVGSRIYKHDQAAAAATDALMKVRGFKRNRAVQGWVTEELDDGVRVTFIGGKKGAEKAALYRAEIGPDGRLRGEPQTFKTPEPLSPYEVAAAGALSLAKDVGFEPCAKKYNSVVLPEGDGLKQWRVYMLPATTKQNIVPLGGSYRFDVDIEAGEAKARPYTNSCIQLESGGPEIVALMTSHLLDPVPTEVHVHWSIWSGKSIYIVTVSNGSMWEVDGPRIMLKKRDLDDQSS